MELSNRVSGAVALFQYRDLLRKGQTLTLISDVHYAFTNTCDQCQAKKSCETVVQLIHRLAQLATASAPTDVLLEMYFVDKTQKSSDSRITRLRRGLSRMYQVHRTLVYRMLNESRRRVSGEDSTVEIGLLSRILQRYLNEFLRHRKAFPHARFHHVDIRDEPILMWVHRVLAFPDHTSAPPNNLWQFTQMFPTGRHARRFFSIFALSHTFVADMKTIGIEFPPDLLTAHLTGPLGDTGAGRDMHRVAKEISKLGARQRSRVSAFFLQELDAILVRYDKYMNLMKQEPEVRDLLLQKLYWKVVFEVMGLYMDVYTIARLLYHSQTSAHMLMCAGHAHVLRLNKFLQRHLAGKPSVAVDNYVNPSPTTPATNRVVGDLAKLFQSHELGHRVSRIQPRCIHLTR
jgi:hypothetical protein